MHFIKRIEHPSIQVSLFSWNGKYIVKFEMNQMEQTYKISETDVSGADEVEKAVNEAFITSVIKRFEAMSQDWYSNF
jgi:hypothetical protein